MAAYLSESANTGGTLPKQRASTIFPTFSAVAHPESESDPAAQRYSPELTSPDPPPGYDGPKIR